MVFLCFSTKNPQILLSFVLLSHPKTSKHAFHFSIMNFFAALTCTIFAWGLAEGSKVFLRNFQSAEVSFPRTRRTHSYDRFGTNIRGCSGLRCTNKADGILQGMQLSQLHQQNRRHSCAWLVHFLLWQAAKPSGDKCTLEIS